MTNLELLVSTDIYLEDQRAILTTNLSSDEEALKLIVEAIEKAGYKPGEEVC